MHQDYSLFPLSRSAVYTHVLSLKITNLNDFVEGNLSVLWFGYLVLNLPYQECSTLLLLLVFNIGDSILFYSEEIMTSAHE